MEDASRELAWAPLKRAAEDPFLVLGLSMDAGKAQIRERARSLIRELAAEDPAVKRYRTPLGDRERSAALVAWAAAELANPDRRLAHELWHLGTGEHAVPTPARWPGAMRAFGWRSR